MSGPAIVLPGDPAPVFAQRSGSNPNFIFDTVAGRYILLCFLGSAGSPQGQAAVSAIQALDDIFDQRMALLFFVSNDPADETEARLAERHPGHRIFWDVDLKVARLYGAAPQAEDGPLANAPRWVLLDPTLRMRSVVPFRPDRS